MKKTTTNVCVYCRKELPENAFQFIFFFPYKDKSVMNFVCVDCMRKIDDNKDLLLDNKQLLSDDERIKKISNDWLKLFIQNNGYKSRVNILESELISLKCQLKNIILKIDEEKKIEYTGWYAFLKKDKNGNWEVIKCMNPDLHDDDEYPETFDLCLSIPDPDTLREFDGF